MMLKKQIIPRRCNGGMGEDDKISKLPDALIHHIYSFLPTKSVLSTCILSKRWKDLSNSAPILDFRKWVEEVEENYDYVLDAQKMMNFVDTVLFIHEKPKIQKFLLRVDGRFDETRVNRWITTVIKHKVEELVLSIQYENPFMFPLSLFTCDSLIMLELEYEYFNILNLPNTISFPRLKTLRLSYVSFLNENVTTELISSCPILEDLSLVNCQFQDLKVLCITSRTLKHLTIMNCHLFLSTLKISAPYLLTIKYSTNLPADFVFESFQSLVEAEIEINNSHRDPKIYVPLIRLYKKLSNAKLLKTCGSSLQGLAAAKLPIGNLPIFCNLVSLEVDSAFCRKWGLLTSIDFRLFLWFLRLSPNLESIVFTGGVRSDLQDDNWTVSSSRQHALSNLKSVVIRQFSGCKVELNVVKIFLANAGALQTMTITTAAFLSKDCKKQLQIASELLKFPRTSTSCVLKFLTPE